MTASWGVAAVVLFASFVQGFAGFGFGLLAVPLLTLFNDPHAVVPFVAMCGQVINTILFVKHRRNVRWEVAVPMLAGAVAGSIPGLFFLQNVDDSYLRTFLAAVLVLYSAYALFLTKPVVALGRVWASIAGALAGIMGTGMSTNGPPVIVYVTLQPWAKEVMKGTLTGFLFSAGWIVVAAHAVGGVSTLPLFELFALHAPLVVAGTLAGARLFTLAGERSYEKAVYTLTLAMGLLIYPW